MLSRGAETEVFSNIPSGLLNEELKRKQEAKIKRLVETSHAISNELYSQSGSEMIRIIGNMLESNINELLSATELSNSEILRLLTESKAYIKLLDQLGFKINIGKKVFETKIQMFE